MAEGTHERAHAAAPAGERRTPLNGEQDEHAELAAEIDLTREPTRVDLHDPERRTEVEAALTAVPGLVGARLVPGFDREVDEVHVLSTLERNPKQTVRDIQTVLMARFGLTTDHRVISVVQLDEDQGQQVSRRVAIAEVGLRRVGESVVAEVVLEQGEQEFRLTREAPATEAGRRRAVAHATLDGVRELLHETTAIELEGADVVQVGGTSVAVTVLELHHGRSSELLSGTAIVRDTPQDAIARSVLDATNRLLATSQ
ncbi:MAG: hypothetical protein ACLFRD_06795 [Nitriliruptoraceae bacterium]